MLCSLIRGNAVVYYNALILSETFAELRIEAATLAERSAHVEELRAPARGLQAGQGESLKVKARGVRPPRWSGHWARAAAPWRFLGWQYPECEDLPLILPPKWSCRPNGRQFLPFSQTAIDASRG
jgi:hypothetical protein